MSLDEAPWREMARAMKEREEAAAFADWQHELYMESVAAEEQRFANRWEQQSADLAMSKESHPSRYIDARCFDVDGYTPADGHDW